MNFPRQTTDTVIAIGPYRHARPGRLTSLLHRNADAKPVDLPHVESQEIAASIPAQPMVSVVDPGKGLGAAAEALIDNVTAIDALRGRGACQRCSSTNEVVRIRMRQPEQTLQLCCECRPLGVLSVVDGGGDVA